MTTASTDQDRSVVAMPDENIPAERAVLGAMLRSREAVNRARLDLTTDAFYRPTHAELFDLICRLEDDGHRCDAQLLVTHLAAAKQLGTDGSKGLLIFDLWEGCITPANVAVHTRAVRNAARVRALQQAHVRLGQSLEMAAHTGDVDTLLDAAAARSVDLQAIADAPDTDAPVDGLTTWDVFVTTKSGDDRWIVPDFLGVHDMVMVLAAPGSGKSFLSRQVCTTLAAGVHPFTLERIRPVRTLLVDLENAPGQVADESLPLLAQVKRIADDGLDDRGWVWMQPEGLNIRQRSDAQLFERVIAEVRPDVVAFGSLGQAYRRGSDGWDVAGDEVHDVLKRLRTRYNLAFWIEHHMGRAAGGAGHTGTPFGGTSWEKWPTHGRVLRRAHDRLEVYLLESGTFRGDRGARPGIPIAVQRGGRLPLTAIYEPAELELILEAAQ